jgi:septal ring factor EnvC (AmiA/AmiB activator)
LDHEIEGRSGFEQLAIKVGSYAGIFLAGALIAFIYSYAPLHSGKNWEIDYLEERLESKEESLGQATRDLARVQSESADKPDGQTFKLLQEELATTDKTIRNLERKLDRSERRTKELERSRKNWKAKYAALESEQAALSEEPPPVEADSLAGLASSPDALPASPSPGGSALEPGDSARSMSGSAAPVDQ